MTNAEIQALVPLLKSKRQRRFRQQRGTVVERDGSFWLRFYRDGDNGARVKITEKLCDRDTRHHSADSMPVKLLRDARMAAINQEAHQALKTQAPLPEPPPMTIGAFVLTTYLRWVKENRRWSTHRGYSKMWEQYLKWGLLAPVIKGAILAGLGRSQ
ncbi:MAG: hypothetical protein WB660_14185 [Candidatus Sulfotelmatobacter sp.]